MTMDQTPGKDLTIYLLIVFISCFAFQTFDLNQKIKEHRPRRRFCKMTKGEIHRFCHGWEPLQATRQDQVLKNGFIHLVE